MHTSEFLLKSKLGGKNLGQYSLTFFMIPSSKLLACLLILLPSNKLLIKDITIPDKLKSSGCLQAHVLNNSAYHFCSVGYDTIWYQIQDLSKQIPEGILFFHCRFNYFLESAVLG